SMSSASTPLTKKPNGCDGLVIRVVIEFTHDASRESGRGRPASMARNRAERRRYIPFRRALSMVRKGGFEPPLDSSNYLLRLARLPFRHFREWTFCAGELLSIAASTDSSSGLMASTRAP